MVFDGSKSLFIIYFSSKKLKWTHYDLSFLSASAAVGMVNRQKILLIVALGASFSTIVGFYLFYRNRKTISNSKHKSRVATIPSLLSPKKTITPEMIAEETSEISEADSELSSGSNESSIPDGGVPLTQDQAAFITHLIVEKASDPTLIHDVLRSIANATVFRDSQINLTEVGCILRLEELFFKSNDKTTKCEILLALTDLALSSFAINQFRNFICPVIEFSQSEPNGSKVRSSSLNLLMNMSVLWNLHDEYMRHIEKLDAFIGTTIDFDDEALSSSKILVNLSKNRSNLNHLLELKSVSIVKILQRFQSSNDEEIRQRFLTFFIQIGSSIRCADKNNNENPNFRQSKSFDSLFSDYFLPEKRNVLIKFLTDFSTSKTEKLQIDELRRNVELIVEIDENPTEKTEITI